MWARVNPAVGAGRGGGMEFLEEQRRTLGLSLFAREHLCVWEPEPGESGGAIDGAAWSALADPQAARGSSPVFAVATAPDRSWSAVAVAWKRPDGLPQVMLADYRQDATWVAARATELKSTWGGRVVAANRAAHGLVPDAQNLSEADQAVAHNALSDAVLAGAVHHGNEPAMNTAVRAARWKLSGNTRVLDQKGNSDISPLTAAAGAVHALTTTPATGGWMVGV